MTIQPTTPAAQHDDVLTPEQWEAIRPRVVKRILRTLERMQRLTGFHHEELADMLRPHLKAAHLVELACYLERVGGYMSQQARKCAGCGCALEYTVIDGRETRLRFIRDDALYCSPKCKQKAYGKRVTASRSRAKGKPSRVTAAPLRRVA